MNGTIADAGFGADFPGELARLFALRRDIRNFRREPLPEGMIEHLLGIACLAPSVGLSQPWRFVIVDAPRHRQQIRENFARCNAAAGAAYAEGRAARYAALKLAGLDDAPCQVAVFAETEPEAGHGLGRQSMPETVAYSAVMAIHTLWLAARAEGIGLGWVSILDPGLIASELGLPRHWVFIGYLCIGYPASADAVPELERRGWEQRRDPASFIIRR
jgi:5,6-dimethylbenzimidazole synthase